MNRRTLLAAVAAGVALGPLAMPLPVLAQIPVTDAAANLSLTQQLINQARSLYNEAQGLTNQVTQITNQVTSLTNEARMLASLPLSVINEVQGAYNQVNGIIQQAQGYVYTAQDIQRALSEGYPQAIQNASFQQLMATTNRLANDLRGTQYTSMSLQNDVANLIPDTANRVNRVEAATMAATGQTAAIQGVAQLITITTEQLAELQELLATQGRMADARYTAQQAERAAAQELGRRASETIDASPWTRPINHNFFGIQ